MAVSAVEKTMKTSYFEIETIIAQGNEVTIAASITLEGILYSEPIYTNIFCCRDQLLKWLEAEVSPIAGKILPMFIAKGEGKIQVDLEDYNENRRWRPDCRVLVEPVESSHSGFACYDLIAFEFH